MIPFFRLQGVTLQSFSAPAFGDLDSDGDYDLILGNLDNKAEYFQNITAQPPSVFSKDTNMLSSIYASGLQFTNSAYPTLVDLDDDRDLDLIIGGYNGLLYYKNVGDTLNAIWLKDTTVFADSVNPQIGTDARQAFADLDGDGDEDVLIGAETGSNYVYLLREGNNFNTAASNPFATISVPNYSRPSFADIDNDGDFDLILGRSFGELNYYENIGNTQNPQWQRNDALVSDVKVKQTSAPGFADLDNDGRIDCVIGEYDGNFTYYKNLFAVVSVEEESFEIPSGFYLSQNYPNPFNPTTRIKYQVSLKYH